MDPPCEKQVRIARGRDETPGGPRPRWSVRAIMTIGWILVALVVSVPAATGARPAPPPAGTLLIEYFWGDGCPHCATQRQWLDSLLARHPHLRLASYEVWHDAQNRERFMATAAAHGGAALAVPATFVAGRAWIGFSPAVAREIEALVAGAAPPGRSADTVLALPLIGEVDLGAHSLLAATVLIAFVDGFNPCSLWVLTLLLGIVVHSGSRGRVVVVGATFLTVTATLYGAFVAGLFTAFAVVGVIWWVRVVVALIAGVFGAVNVKDYFWYKAGVSFTIPESRKPGIYRDIRWLATPGRSLPALIGATAVMAAGITLVELPCTAGFPVLWSALMTSQGVAGAQLVPLLGAYVAVYLLDELAVFAAFAFTLRTTRFQERHGRLLKLVGGMIMLALAAALLAAPGAMTTVGGSLGVFGAALALTAAIAILHRVVLPRFGLRIGDERRG